MNKVYCKNCKYFRQNYSGGYRCNFRIQKHTKSKSKSAGKWINEGEIIWDDYDIWNKDNNCEYYKRKWYKFWIK